MSAKKRERRRSLVLFAGAHLRPRVDVGELERAEALAILVGSNESLHHLGSPKVPVKGVQFVKPEVEACGVWITAKVAEVLHRDKGPVELSGLQLFRLRNLA
ncbi:MAG TPA: hypothetical protein VIR01_10135, partial [Pyrinomonadaceae bacterium]